MSEASNYQGNRRLPWMRDVLPGSLPSEDWPERSINWRKGLTLRGVLVQGAGGPQV